MNRKTQKNRNIEKASKALKSVKPAKSARISNNTLPAVTSAVSSLPGIKHGHEILREFMEFLSSKAVLPVAIGLIVADIVKQIVGVLVDGIIRPFIALFLPSNNNFGAFNFVIHGQVFKFGDLVSVLLQAFIIFAVLYLLFAKLLKKREILEGKKK